MPCRHSGDGFNGDPPHWHVTNCFHVTLFWASVRGFYAPWFFKNWWQRYHQRRWGKGPCSFHDLPPLSFQVVTSWSFWTFFSCSFFIYPCSLLLAPCLFLLLHFFLLHAPVQNFPLLHASFLAFFYAPCSRIDICLLTAPLSISGLAPCSFVPYRACSLPQNYP